MLGNKLLPVAKKLLWKSINNCLDAHILQNIFFSTEETYKGLQQLESE